MLRTMAQIVLPHNINFYGVILVKLFVFYFFSSFFFVILGYIYLKFHYCFS